MQKATGEVESGRDITFDTTVINIGEAFHAESGIFVALETGSYRFSFTAESQDNGPEVQVVVNGQPEMLFTHDADLDLFPRGFHSDVWQMNLLKGDFVNLYLLSGNFNVDGERQVYVSFIGELITTM